MTLEMVLQIVGYLVLFISAVGGFAYWLARLGINHWMRKNFESFRISLQQEAKQKEIQYSSLHLERANAIKSIYSQYHEALSATRSFVNLFQADSDSQYKRGQAAYKLCQELKNNVILNRLYFEESVAQQLCDDAGALSELALSSLLDFEHAKDAEDNPYNRKYKYFSSAFRQLEESRPEIMKKMESEFRHLLGTTNNVQQSDLSDKDEKG